ncbi:unnamed protein product, partial [Musa acuminata subsp. burmannicoides]
SLAGSPPLDQRWPSFAPFLPPFGLFFARWGFRIAGTVLPLASLAVRRSPLAARRSLAQPKMASFGPFLGCFGMFLVCSCVARRPSRAEQNVSHLSTLEPPGWHRAGWGFRIAGTVLPHASLAVRRSPLARAAKNGQFWPVFGLFWPVFGLFLRAAATVVSGA